MKTTIEFDLQPFPIPSEVRDTSGAEYELYLTALPAETLAALCDEFRANVFKAAGKEPPPEVRPVSRRDDVALLLGDILAEFDHAPPWDIGVLRIKLKHALVIVRG